MQVAGANKAMEIDALCVCLSPADDATVVVVLFGSGADLLFACCIPATSAKS